MTTDADLKVLLHRDISRLDKLLLTLSTFDEPCSISELKNKALTAGLKIPNSWNPSSLLTRSNGLAIRTHLGWEVSSICHQYFQTKDFLRVLPPTFKTAIDFRKELKNIANEDTRQFVKEAVLCYEAKLYRSAVVMSWLAAVDVLQQYVLTNILEKFNVEAKRRNSKWRKAKTAEDLALMREAEFLDCIAAIKIIGSNVKSALKRCLDLRNSCSHPNSLKIAAHAVASHVEVLLLNVFNPFVSSDDD